MITACTYKLLYKQQQVGLHTHSIYIGLLIRINITWKLYVMMDAMDIVSGFHKFSRKFYDQ